MTIARALQMLDVRYPSVLPAALAHLEKSDGAVLGKVYDWPSICARTTIVFSFAMGAARWFLGKTWPVGGGLAAVIVSAVITWECELGRVSGAVRTKALALFRGSDPCPTNTLAYLANDLLAMMTLLEENQTAQLKEKLQKLLQWTIPNSFFKNGRSCEAWQLVESEHQLLSFKIMQEIFSKNGRFALYLLENELVYPCQWDAETQENMWAATEDIQVMHVLRDHGLKLNEMVMLKKFTQIFQDYEETKELSGLQGLCGLLSLGAEVPDLARIFFRRAGEVVEVSLPEEIAKHPSLAVIVSQAKKVKKDPVLADEKVSLWSWKPLVNIALRQGQFEVAAGAIFQRAMNISTLAPLVGLALFDRIVDSRIRLIMGIAVVVAARIFYSCYTEWNVKRATEYLNEKVVNGAFNANFPAHAITQHLAQHPPLWERLAQVQLNQIDNQGKTIFDCVQLTSTARSKEEFVHVMRLLEEVCAKGSFNREVSLEKLAKAGDGQSLQYLVSKNLITQDEYQVLLKKFRQPAKSS
jgi:hypothetical protein